jgi:hypothetical protein
MTAFVIPGTWERLRARLSHDRMKNQILPMTSRLCQILEGRVESRGFVADFSSIRLAEIEEVCREVEALLAATEEAASPRVFFSAPPLNRCPPDTLAWLPDAVHEKWLEEKFVKSRIESAQGALVEVRHASLSLELRLKETSQKSSMAARKLQKGLLSLAECVSALGDLMPYRC